MEGESSERRRWSPVENQRGLECRRCGVTAVKHEDRCSAWKLGRSRTSEGPGFRSFSGANNVTGVSWC